MVSNFRTKVYTVNPSVLDRTVVGTVFKRPVHSLRRFKWNSQDARFSKNKGSGGKIVGQSPRQFIANGHCDSMFSIRRSVWQRTVAANYHGQSPQLHFLNRRHHRSKCSRSQRLWIVTPSVKANMVPTTVNFTRLYGCSRDVGTDQVAATVKNRLSKYSRFYVGRFFQCADSQAISS